ncbi:Ribonucleotide reductase small chain family protein [Theileria parva strain Muguga]|uniref:Ribonucleotide reductase small chain family protein n=1 Tax=Theileria parva strain Muguga TaxID=333668 RepID=UPI001C622B9C|nr:Ribonucleotide reductase small chain family protein [Theileria parva strain Muguga]EAN34434.2 Ribonucleotide reductase small chain family protein [Theileria parva strain Muguga]
MSGTMVYKYLPCASIEEVQNDEILLKENHNRWVMFPIEHDTFWIMYKEVENNFWAAEDFIFSDDLNSLFKLPKPLFNSLFHLLSFHINLDNKWVCRPVDMTLELLSEVQIAEARAFYGFQLTDENIHTETIGTMFQLLNQPLDNTIGQDKITWLYNECEKNKCFFKRVLLVVISKLLFTATFNILRDYLVKEKLLPTFTLALDAVSKDRHIHTRFAHCTFTLLQHKMLESDVVQLIKEALKLEYDFANKFLPLSLMAITQNVLRGYMEWVGNNVLMVCGYRTLYSSDFDVEWLNHPTVDLNIRQVIKKQKTEHTTEIKFDEDF